ncbi:tRNA (cytosine(72)-C(5))-methyltransferase NSUN6 isoform X2 [Prorops nasuta]|uniref:tRNA (cytosine(72)-C(5))-methyltransferase NSUN6 isoform X2 n=1 Tax=Prorops nasuta TaxID=863751 RepID=UPI0034CF97FC
MNDFVSPFKFHNEIFDELYSQYIKIKNSNLDVPWLCLTPEVTTYRVNVNKITTEEVIAQLREKIKITKPTDIYPVISTFPFFPELIIIHKWNESVQLDLSKYSNEIIVDEKCGAAVLRGSHIFAPGIIGISHKPVKLEKVSVFADKTGNCKKGLIKEYKESEKVFLGNGILKQTRKELFGGSVGTVSGIGVYMTDVISHLPQLNCTTMPQEWGLLQNLPSMICSRILDPQPNERILDMCAAPGNKTTHISSLMKNQGALIALDISKSKIKKIEGICKELGCYNVKSFCYDSTKAVCNDISKESIENTPPFPRYSFDRILLDAPCSGMGQRPQLHNRIKASCIRSYSSIQKKLFSAAVELLKPGGVLVYSTCTVTIAENEEIVSWALQKYPNLCLKHVRHKMELMGLKDYGAPGYVIDHLTEDQCENLCRFGPQNDVIGFFISCFVKNGIDK